MLKFKQYGPTLGNMALVVICLLSLCANAHSQQTDGLYEYIDNSRPLYEVTKGDNEFSTLALDKPIHFFSESYDQIFINTNGILTFNIEFPEYINQPFPLEYPSIAPFYSNVDTSGNNPQTSITMFESQDPEQLHRASSMVRYAFTDKPDFEATRIIVGTWKNVGYFESKTDLLNTFQAVIISNDDDTFVQYIYPQDGLNWLQGETGPLGLPDIRPQVGFVAEDGRVFNLDGSATENARYLAKSSNVGRAGNWIYQVGPLNVTSNVRPPTNVNIPQELPKMFWTCAEATHGYCSSHAKCFDKSAGFCCVCQDNYFGNGRDCIKNDLPLRVTGSMSGEINGEVITDRVKMQSYVQMTDARSYTSINPAEMDLGSNLRFALPIVTTIGWLFAKPTNGALNGYQLTGGVFTQESKLHFESGEILTVNQTFEGLNYWDQLSVKIEVFGSVPRITFGTNLHMADYIDEYRFEGPNTIRSVHAHSIEVADEKRVINFQLDQTIRFERCLLEGDNDFAGTSVLQKVSKIVLDYSERDQALRSSVINKIGVNAESNVCTEDTTVCGPNTVCVPYEDTYRCDCLHGYGAQLDSSGTEVCLDIDECAIGSHVCDENALCSNTEGGFSCVCADGFVGNGYRCLVNSTADNIETPQQIVNVDNVGTEHDEYVTPENNYNPDSQCYHCSPNADCYEGRCICRGGFSGNGYECENQCPYGQAWLQDRCQPVQNDYLEIESTCDFLGTCTCPEGFTLGSDGHICHNGGPDNGDARDLVPCDVEDNCHANATCEWYEPELRFMCICNPGFHGDGYQCSDLEECTVKPDVCDVHAACSYDDALGKSVCMCDKGYQGDGFNCQLAPECRETYDCGQSAWCDHGTCQCLEGFERDVSDNCVPAGRCGSVYCGANAICKWDSVQEVQYCDCMEGYEGNALEGCRSIPIPCNIRNNCGVHARCEPTEDPAKYECHCDSGYRGDGYVCIEIENCLNHPNLCDMNAKCSSTNSGLVCVCNAGFYGNGSVCLERQRHESGFLLVSQGVVIVRKALGSKMALPIAVASMAIGLDKDCVAGRVYWGDISKKTIESAFYDGSDRRIFINEDVESPEGFAVDASSRRIYWTDSVKDTIEVASLDDAKLRAIIINKNLVNPRGIAIDPFREKLYWADWNRESPKIEMSNLDGTGRELLVGPDILGLPNSLVVLESSGELCFADAGTKKVQCIEPFSKILRTISHNLSYPFGLTFSQNQFYWTDWTTKKLESVDTYGDNHESQQIALFGSHKMFGMTAIEDNCPQPESPCQINNGGCTDNRLCIANRQAPSGKSCKCTALSQGCTVPRFEGQF